LKFITVLSLTTNHKDTGRTVLKFITVLSLTTNHKDTGRTDLKLLAFLTSALDVYPLLALRPGTKQEIEAHMNEENIVRFIKSQRLAWYGHVNRMEDNKNVNEVEPH
jgi:hypothetical protein